MPLMSILSNVASSTSSSSSASASRYIHSKGSNLSSEAFISSSKKEIAQSSTNNNTKLVNYGLSLSAGSMLTTAIYKILPKMTHDNRFSVFFGVAGGIIGSMFLNFLVHSFASGSLVHCSHGEHDGSGEHFHSHDILDGNVDEEEYGNDDSYVSLGRHVNSRHGHGECVSGATETEPLLSHGGYMTSDADSTTAQVKPRKSFFDLVRRSKSNGCIGDCRDLLSCNAATLTLRSAASMRSLSKNNYYRNADSRGGTGCSGGCNAHCGDTTRDNIDSATNIPDCFCDSEIYVDGKPTTGHCGISCVENAIGYDLENLDYYRKNFLSGTNVITTAIDSWPDEGGAEDTSVSETLRSNANVGETTGATAGAHPQSASPMAATTAAAAAAGRREEEVEEGRRLSIISAHGHRLHHHHVETPFSKLLSIGMQTCLVLTLHKFPEGFIIYYTNNAKQGGSGSGNNSDLGFSIFVSLAIHNFVEGFAMTLPLYSVFETKWLALLITTILCGGSQPLGALIGYLIFRGKGIEVPNGSGDPKADIKSHMTLLLSITAGFLLVIALQMFQTGVGFSDAHHHHPGDDDSEIHHSHSSGNTCLKWCLGGVLLILAGSMFV